MENVVQSLTKSLTEGTKSQFLLRRSVMSFQDYLAEVIRHPQRHVRSAAQYFADMIDYFGCDTVSMPTGEEKRYRLFDMAFDGGEGQVMGHEGVQGHLVRLINNFKRAGRADRLVLLHGPNGSAKTSLVQALGRAAEVYSEKEEGALYRFSFVFPLKKAVKGGLGFASSEAEHDKSYAYLNHDQIEARIPCEHKDHPLFLLPMRFREQLLQDLLSQNLLPADFSVPHLFRKGDLSAKNKKIFDALLTSYQGDVNEVLKHIQVQRFYLSRRYHVGIAAVEPQMSVDAFVRQVTADQSFASLPPALQYMALYETGGALAAANRGLIEYNDLLKRPIESWKYLLVATEQAQVNVDVVSLFLDMLMIATSNELHLSSFREYPDWQSFKGRFELVNVPYLRRFSDEIRIYENQIPRALVGTHIAPHAIAVAARFAVLTRLEAPRSDLYPEGVRDLLRTLTPLEKLTLYDSGQMPERLSQKEVRQLKPHVPKLFHEYDNELEYEGRYGASPREIRTLLLNAAQDRRFDHLSPFAVLSELRLLIREKSSYEYLRREPIRGYRDAHQFVDVVERELLEKIDEDIRSAVGLVGSDLHKQLFERYIKNVSAWTKNERLLDPRTNKLVPADTALMAQVERILLARVESPEDFRRSLIAQIGAYRLEHPDDEMDYTELFGAYLRRLKEDYYAQQHKAVERIQNDFLRVVEGETRGIDEKDIQQVQGLRQNLYAMGYNDASAQKSIAYLLRVRT